MGDKPYKKFAVTCVALTLAACSPAQQERAKVDVTDGLIAGQVQAKIAAVDPATVSLVHVNVDHAVVTLSGQVHSATERAKVDEAARSVSGVRSVNDHLVVNPKAPTADEITKDLELQAKVKTALAAQTGVNALKVQVSSHGGAVTLDGEVPTKAVHDVVLETVHGVPGVRSVIDRLHVERR